MNLAQLEADIRAGYAAGIRPHKFNMGFQQDGVTYACALGAAWQYVNGSIVNSFIIEAHLMSRYDLPQRFVHGVQNGFDGCAEPNGEEPEYLAGFDFGRRLAEEFQPLAAP